MPYSEHSARLQDPEKLKKREGFLRVRTSAGDKDTKVQGVTIPSTIKVIWYIFKDDAVIAQALRFPKEDWTAKEAKAWLTKNKIDYILFEPAEEAEDVIIYAKKSAPRVFDYYIGGHIGQDVNCNYIAQEIITINNQKLADRINVHINSEGGEVINGVALISQIMQSDIPVYTINEGYAMSMAGYLWLSAHENNRLMVDFGVLMLHAAKFYDESGKEVEPEDENEAKFLQIVRDQLSTILARCTRKSKRAVQEMLSQDSYFTAKDCVNEGFCLQENIISYGKKPDISSLLSTKENIKRIAAFYNDDELKNFKINNDMKTLLSRLGLATEASEASAISKVEEMEKTQKSLESKASQLEADLKTEKDAKKAVETERDIMKAKLTDYEKKETEAKKVSATQLVEKAITDGLFDPKKKTELIAQAEKDYDGVKMIIESSKPRVVSPDLTKQIANKTIENRDAEAAKYGLKGTELTIEHLEKANPKKLQMIKDNDPVLFDLMSQEYIVKFG